jgi:hypothetical protein
MLGIFEMNYLLWLASNHGPPDQCLLLGLQARATGTWVKHIFLMSKESVIFSSLSFPTFIIFFWISLIQFQ